MKGKHNTEYKELIDNLRSMNRVLISKSFELGLDEKVEELEGMQSVLIQEVYNSKPLKELLPNVVFPLEENARKIAKEIEKENALLQKFLLGEKSLIFDATTAPEATNAFIELYKKIIEETTRKLIEEKIGEGAELGLPESDIINGVEEALKEHQEELPEKIEVLALGYNGKLSEVRQKEADVKKYRWITMGDDKVRPSHVANSGQIFTWDSPPATGHPGTEYNCRCGSEPIQVAMAQIPRAVLKEMMKKSIGKVGKAAEKVIKTKPKTPAPKPKKPTSKPKKPNDTEWKFGKHKSETKWNNQKQKRGWTNDKITDTIKDGEQFPAPNKVNPGNGATRYQTKDGRYVVRDNVTKEILQVSDDKFKPN